MGVKRPMPGKRVGPCVVLMPAVLARGGSGRGGFDAGGRGGGEAAPRTVATAS
jgi:hypothetical protein